MVIVIIYLLGNVMHSNIKIENEREKEAGEENEKKKIFLRDFASTLNQSLEEEFIYSQLCLSSEETGMGTKKVLRYVDEFFERKVSEYDMLSLSRVRGISASGEIHVMHSFHTIDTYGDAASDDLDTINGGNPGDVLVLRAENADHTVILKNGTGNLHLAGNFYLDNIRDSIQLVYDGSKWLELSRSNNGA